MKSYITLCVEGDPTIVNSENLLRWVEHFKGQFAYAGLDVPAYRITAWDVPDPESNANTDTVRPE